MKSAKTDFCKGDAYQKIVRFGSDGTEIVTVGNDEKVRVWDFPELSSKVEIALPTDEGSDATSTSTTERKTKTEDVDCDGELIAIVTTSSVHIRARDSQGLVASLAAKSGYAFRCARFLQADAKYLVTVENSTGSSRPLLSLWPVGSWTRRSSIRIPSRLRVTTLSVAKGLIAFGAADGTVGVYNAQLRVHATDGGCCDTRRGYSLSKNITSLSSHRRCSSMPTARTRFFFLALAMARFESRVFRRVRRSRGPLFSSF